MVKWGRRFGFYTTFIFMMTNKADYVLGIRNYILLNSTLDKEELEIPLPSKND